MVVCKFGFFLLVTKLRILYFFQFVGELIDLASSLFAYMFVDKAKQLEDALSEDDWPAVKLHLNSLMGLAEELEMAIEVFKEEEMY